MIFLRVEITTYFRGFLFLEEERERKDPPRLIDEISSFPVWRVRERE